ncbi:bacterio-opsin activator domain-containing protein [Natrarchaeobaculum aegyptiacum]|uniref:Histidine kinase n=1 Tax=Natrarchaeobaculum aegyptiacum TaxID=745377 RepID=A0A2Z2HZ09_9EURY|nr:bacterio-opsin activator domain-containing protein [Natrarchaeobaculum aegyptiacum]ARS90404.1 histidine kinase [Natrarchaeobaculum aegyptiacum]
MSIETATDAVLSRRQYESLLDAAETYREALVVRLCGEVGLRPAELAELSIEDVEQVRMDPPRYLVRVPPVGDRSGRTAYLPTNVERELRRYARSNDLAAADRIFTVTPRRLQMLVADVAERASDLFEDPSLAEISSSDLRQYFLYRALVANDVNPRVVKAAGGWQSFEALEPYLPEPTETELVDAFEAVERPGDPRRSRSGGQPGTGSAVSDDSVIRLLLAASDRYALVRLDEDGYVERWNRSGAALFGYRAGEIVGTHVSAFYTDEAVENGRPERTLAAALEESGYEAEGLRVHKDGSRFRATEVITPLRDDRGRHRGYAVFVRDVSSLYEELESVTDRCETLERREAVARGHRRLTLALLAAEDHEAVERNACAAIVDGDAYAFAWIDRTTVDERTMPRRAASGVDPDAIDGVLPDDWDGAQAVVGDGGPKRSTTVDVIGEPAGNEASGANDEDRNELVFTTPVDGTLEGERFDGTVASVPLSDGDTTYGTLSVATRRAAIDDEERRWLETIARQVGYAIRAVRRRNLLLSDRVVELEIVCRDDESFFVDASRRLGCRFELDSLVAISETTQLYYLYLEGAEPAAVFDLVDADHGIEDCRLIETDEDGCRLEFVVEGSSPTLTLTEYGMTVVDAVFADGVATITAECAADADLRTIVDGLRASFPDSEVVSKRETERAVQTAREFRDGLEERLTDRQEAALRAAYFGGYYDWPRESTAEEVADAMGISSPTLHNHLRKGQHELLRTFFDDPGEETIDGE